MNMVMKQFDPIACHLAAWAEDGQAIPKDLHVLSFDSSVTILQSQWVVSFAWIGLALAFVNKGSRMRIITISHHLSSPQSSTSRNLTTFSTLEWKYSKFLCLFAMISSSFAMVLLGFLPFNWQWESFVWRPVWVNRWSIWFHTWSNKFVLVRRP